MSNVLKIKRGNFSELPALGDGEQAFCKDTNQLFIGRSGTNVEIETVHSLVHSYNIGTKTHNLTGTIPTTGLATFRFKATETFNEGDTFTVNGQAFSAKPTGELLDMVSSTFIPGDIVTVEGDILGKKLSFSGGLGRFWGWRCCQSKSV